MSKTSDHWLKELQSNGYRLTGSRKTVVEIIASSRHALSPLELYDIARARHSSMGLVTVYRTLEKLEELRLIQRVHHPKGCQAFISAFNGHQHLILCSSCGKAAFFEGDNLDTLIDVIGQQTGYHVQDHWLQLFGTCTECQEGKERT